MKKMVTKQIEKLFKTAAPSMNSKLGLTVKNNSLWMPLSSQFGSIQNTNIIFKLKKVMMKQSILGIKEHMMN